MKNLLVLFTVLSGFLFFSCSTEITSPAKENSGKLLLKIDKQNAPESVLYVKAYLTRENFEPITGTLNLLSDSTADLLLNEIDAGTWHLKVDAEDDSGLVLYTGETDVEVFAGFTSQVYLSLQPTGAGVGSIYINVTWGVPVNHSWMDYQYNPLIESSGNYYDYYAVSMPQVLYDGGIYKMWYLGTAAAAKTYVIYAESQDGINWIHPINHPVLYPGNNGEWDSWSVQATSVFKEDNTYKMLYCGYSDQYDIWNVGFATSSDGINWQKHPDPLLYGTSGWEHQVAASSLIKKNDTYYLYYTGRNIPNYQIGVAISIDGINFTRYSENPILISETSWEQNCVGSPTVFEENGLLKMLYMGMYGFGFANSSDGLHWTKYQNNPFFTEDNTANGWAISRITHPRMIRLSNEIRIYYSGIGTNGNYRIGMMRKSNN